MTDWPTGLMVIQGNRLESLKDILVEWIKRYPLKPLETDKFLVQSNGIAQWLQQALAQDISAGGCGIAASIDVELPGRFVWQAYRSVFWDLDTQSPYDLKPMTWRLFRLLNTLDSRNETGAYDALIRFIALGKNPAHRRYILAERIAKLYDQYQVYRADWLQAWEAELDVLPKAEEPASNGSKAVPEEQIWQPMLWRLLVADVQADPSFDLDEREVVNRSRIHQEFLDYCKNAQSIEALPRRVVIFGISSLPTQTLEVLQAIAPFTQVLLFTMNPSEYYWGDLIEGRQLLRQAQSRRPLRSDREQGKEISLDEAHLYGNPLLASWGKLGRDYLHSLDERDHPEHYQSFFVDSKIDLFETPEETTLLEQLQSDIFSLRSVMDCQALQRTIDPAKDDSLRFIETHSRQREIEVLHDLLLNEFEQAQQNGKPLAPRDVLIMAPDINVYVPHIEAVFGRFVRYGDQADPRYLPFHIADQSARQQHPIVVVFETLLALTRSRFAATDLLSLLDVPAVRKRYALQESDVPLLKSWIENANIRWGLSKTQRLELGLASASEQNTWLFGLKRMLLGYSVGSGEMWRQVLPYGEIGGLEASLLGMMHRLVDDIQHVWQSFMQPKPLAEWGEALQSLVHTFFEPESDHESLVISRIEDQIEALTELAKGSGVDQEPVTIDVIQEALMGQLDEPALSQRFLAGSVNFATLMPMRAIPFKQVYLIGMNDGDYPQVSTPMDFDLMVGDYRPGDRSRREDAHYLFLEAVLSARDKLVISWQGRSVKDNSEQPPSVLVGQLRDYIGKCWGPKTLLEQLTQDYPMQPFSRRYFVGQKRQVGAEESEQAAFFTYQKEWQNTHIGVESDDNDGNESQPCLPDWLPDAPLNAHKLATFLRSPVDALYAERLDIRKPSEIEETRVVENFESTGLEEWQVHESLLQYAKKHDLSEQSWDARVEQALQRQIAAGELHDGAFSQVRRERLFPHKVKQLYFAWKRALNELTPIADTLRQAHLSLSIRKEGVDACELIYQDDLERLYQSSSSSEPPIQFILQTSNVYSESRIKDENMARDITQNALDSKVRWRNTVNAWVRHVVANAVHETGVTTQLMTPNGDMRFAAIGQQTAQHYLEQVATKWLQAMHQPACFGIQGGMAYFIQGRSKKTELERLLEGFIEGDLGDGRNHYGRLQFQDEITPEQQAQLVDYAETLCGPLYTSLVGEKR